MATPSASAIPDALPMLIEVPITARTLGPGLAIATKKGTGTALFYRCSWCHKPRRYLYLLTLSRTKLVADLGLRCQVCARLRFGSQGCYRSAFSRLWGTRPRYPWDPQAVSDPGLVQEEFPGPGPPTAADRVQGQAAHETPAKTARTVPLEFKDTATGEHFHVVQDDDLAWNPSAESNEAKESA